MLANEPTSAEARHNHGVCLERLGRVDEAIAHYEETVRLLPESAEARANLDRARARATKRRPR